MKNTNTAKANTNTAKAKTTTIASIKNDIEKFNKSISSAEQATIKSFVTGTQEKLNDINSTEKTNAINMLVDDYIINGVDNRQGFFNNYLSNNALITWYIVNYSEKQKQVILNTTLFRPTIVSIQNALKLYNKQHETDYNLYFTSETILKQQVKMFMLNLKKASLGEIITVTTPEISENFAKIYKGTNTKALKLQLDDIVASIYGNIDYPKLSKKDIEVFKRCLNRAKFKENDYCKISSARENTILTTIVKMQTSKGYIDKYSKDNKINGKKTK